MGRTSEKLFIIIFFTLIGFFIGLLVHSMFIDSQSLKETENNQNSEYNFSIPNSQEEIINRCKNLNLTETSYCFRDNIKTFFNYIDDKIVYQKSLISGYCITNESYDKTICKGTNINLVDYLKENGGICREWSLLYLELCEKTNFQCKEVSNGGITGIFYSHRYMVMYNENEYCKLDQRKVECGEVENG